MENRNLCQYDQTTQCCKVGSYVMDRVIGKGNFSVVKLATHIPTQMQVAVKVLNKLKMSMETLKKTYREVQIMKLLRHNNIVQLYQVIDSSEWMFIIMEYVSLGELFDYLSQIGRLTENDARVKFRQILDAVEYCHKMNIVHRDLKAENLLMDENFNIKLADFGFGTTYCESNLLSTWCGSPPYAAPELFRGEPYNGTKSDIWSLGVVLYAMVCGALPFDEPYSIVKLRLQVLSGLVRFPYFLSYECELLIRMILNRNPNKRPSIPTIRNHKWMQSSDDGTPVLKDNIPITDNKLLRASVQCRSSRRCKTVCDDNLGFGEPFDFTISASEKRSQSLSYECLDYDVNDNVIQIMERCGFKRSAIIEELSQNIYGHLTATYLLLCEKSRIRSRSGSLNGKVALLGATAISAKLVPQPMFTNRCDIVHTPTRNFDPILTTESAIQRIYLEDIPQDIATDRSAIHPMLNENLTDCQSPLCRTIKQIETNGDISQVVVTYENDIPNNIVNISRDSRYCYNIANSFQEKCQISSRVHSNEMNSAKPKTNVTVPRCVILNPLSNVQKTQIQLSPRLNNDELYHRFAMVDYPIGTYPQPLTTMYPIASLYNMPQNPLSTSFYAHSSPQRTTLYNDVSRTLKPRMTKFCDLTIPSTTCEQTSLFRAPLNMRNNQRSNVIIDDQNKTSTPHCCQQSDIIGNIPPDPHLTTNDTNHNFFAIPNSNINSVFLRERLSSMNTTFTVCTDTCQQINIVNASQISPRNIQFVRL